MSVGNGSNIITSKHKTVYGNSFKCSRRSEGHLDRTIKRLAKKARKDRKFYRFVIIQPSFNTSVSASAGTHDYDACFDVRIEGMGWADAQKWLRKQGWAAFWRKPSQGPWSDHIHMVSLPPYMLRFVARVGIYVPGQVSDYYARKNGLSSHLHDPSWHPKVIRLTIFSYRLWTLANRK